jgi:hypothetical protein
LKLRVIIAALLIFVFTKIYSQNRLEVDCIVKYQYFSKILFEDDPRCVYFAKNYYIDSLILVERCYSIINATDSIGETFVSIKNKNTIDTFMFWRNTFYQVFNDSVYLLFSESMFYDSIITEQKMGVKSLLGGTYKIEYSHFYKPVRNIVINGTQIFEYSVFEDINLSYYIKNIYYLPGFGIIKEFQDKYDWPIISNMYNLKIEKGCNNQIEILKFFEKQQMENDFFPETGNWMFE